MGLPTNVVILQPISAFLILAMSVLGGALPYMLMKKTNIDVVLSYLNCASGGVLLGVALLHIFPETGEAMNGEIGGFPMSYCITFVGILLMIIVLALGHNHSHGVKGEQAEAQPLVENVDGETHEHGADEKEQHLHGDCEQEDHHHHEHVPGKSSLFMLFLGLMIHDLCEGMVVGLETDFDSALYLSLAIIIHKWCDVSVQVVAGIRGGLSVKENVYVCIPLVLATPVIQMIAYAIVLATTTDGMSLGLEITQDFFMSFACGTFLAIVFVEILGAELIDRTKKECLLRAATVCAGFVIIAVSSIIEVVSGVE